MRALSRGDIFNTEGYHLCASIDTATGAEGMPARLLVMHNNSSHFLVALSDVPLQMAVDDCVLQENVRYLAAFPYFENEADDTTAYKLALEFAAREALRR